MFWKVVETIRGNYWVLVYSESQATITIKVTEGGLGTDQMEGLIFVSGGGGSSSTRTSTVNPGPYMNIKTFNAGGGFSDKI